MLINRKHRRVYIYCPGLLEKYPANTASVRGDRVLPGFMLNLGKVWERSRYC
ncbi:hypothetical protein WKK05_19360 [Nostoc sp. UHCC 0302]|uniref:hypothetical protein n=1 Tax=Nostoc sp. UHCC 0302 TaxID=3134896 RepID=UPI00311CA982